MNHVDKNNKGFTLIELLLAMGFLSVLLIAIAMTVIQIGSIYNRGITLKEVNQVGRSLASDLQRSIAQAPQFKITSGVGSRYIKQDWGGRLCVGKYSYIWNNGAAIQTGDKARLNVYAGPEVDKVIRFIKIPDPSAIYCNQSSKVVSYSEAIELVNSGEHDLAIHNFSISAKSSASDPKTGQQLYVISFLIGTNLYNTMNGIGTSDVKCKSPDQAGSDPAYCSISRFSIVALAGNAVK